MKPRRSLPFVPLLGLLFLLPSNVQAAQSPNFYERILATGDADDYRTGNRALDLDSIFVSETYKFEPVGETGAEVVTLRLTPVAFQDLQLCTLPTGSPVCKIRYDVHFASGGADRRVNATFYWRQSDDYAGPQLDTSNVAVRANATSVFFLLPRTEFGLLPGTSITRLWATSSVAEDDEQSVQDRIPGDNANTPSDFHPEFNDLFAPDARLEGTYRFFTVEPKTPTSQRSVDGGEARFVFDVRPAVGVHNDQYVILWDAPESWSIVPSRGDTAGRPIGRISELSEGESMEFAFVARARDVVQIGERYTILMHVISLAGGSEYVPFVIEITGEHYDSVDHRFSLLSTGPLRAKETGVIRIGLVDAQGVPDLLGPVSIDFLREGRRHATVPAVARDGAWETAFAFPEAGTWTVDAYLSDLEPAPHGEFTIEVRDAKGSPGPGLHFSMAALAAVLLGRRVRFGS